MRALVHVFALNLFSAVLRKCSSQINCEPRTRPVFESNYVIIKMIGALLSIPDTRNRTSCDWITPRC